jgi:hypothetical protein
LNDLIDAFVLCQGSQISRVAKLLMDEEKELVSLFEYNYEKEDK